MPSGALGDWCTIALQPPEAAILPKADLTVARHPRLLEPLGGVAIKAAVGSMRESNHLFRYYYGIDTLEVAMSAGKWTATPPRIGGNEHDEELHRQLDTIKKRSVATVWQLRRPNISYVSSATCPQKSKAAKTTLYWRYQTREELFVAEPAHSRSTPGLKPSVCYARISTMS